MQRFTLTYRDPETGAPTLPNAKQAIAHASPAEFLLLGGAAFGGKSEFDIVEGSKTCLVYPRVECAMFRTESTELERSIVPRFLQLFPPAGKSSPLASYNHQLGKAQFWNGSIFWFLHAARLNDVYRHQSAQWVKLFIDEASHMIKPMIEYLITRVRRARTDVRKQVVLTSNPGNVGHGYLKATFIKPSIEVLGDRDYPKPFEIWRPRPPKNRPRAYMLTRQFIPAFAHDNVIGMLREPHYLDQILEMGGVHARQLAYGEWDSNDGMVFGEDWQEHRVVTASDEELLATGLLDVGTVIPWHVIPMAWWPPPEAPTWASVDYGFGAPWSFHLHAGLHDQHVRTFYEMYKAGVRDREQARFIRRVIERLMEKPDNGGIGMQKPAYLVYDPQMDHSRKEVGLAQSIKEVYWQELESLGVPMLASGGPGTRLSRIQRVKDALAPAPDGFPHWTVTERCKELIRTLPELPKDPRPGHEEEILEAAEDHAYEDCGRFWQTRPELPKRPRRDLELEALDPISRLNADHVAGKLTPASGVRKITIKGLLG